MNIDVRRGTPAGRFLTAMATLRVSLLPPWTPRESSPELANSLETSASAFALEVVSAFVERHRVKISRSPSEPDLSASQLRTVADQMVVQVRCYILESVGRRRTAPKP